LVLGSFENEGDFTPASWTPLPPAQSLDCAAATRRE
jgi:hypothetical protein